MVECTALEMRHTREGIEGSNPSLSAKSMWLIGGGSTADTLEIKAEIVAVAPAKVGLNRVLFVPD